MASIFDENGVRDTKGAAPAAPECSSHADDNVSVPARVAIQEGPEGAVYTLHLCRECAAGYLADWPTEDHLNNGLGDPR